MTMRWPKFLIQNSPQANNILKLIRNFHILFIKILKKLGTLAKNGTILHGTLQATLQFGKGY